MADMEQYPQEWREYEPIQPRGMDWRGLFRKLGAPIAAIGAFLAKFGVVLLKFKFLFSMFVSAAVYVWIGGWWFGIGLVVLLFVHEMGHVLEAKRQGLPVSAPLFIPFMGALITLNLLPVVPLDGGRITAALHPALWLVGFLGLLGLVIWRPNPILIIILLVSASELWRRWKMRQHPEMQEYYRVKPQQRLIVGALYFGLAILLVLGMH